MRTLRISCGLLVLVAFGGCDDGSSEVDGDVPAVDAPGDGPTPDGPLADAARDGPVADALPLDALTDVPGDATPQDAAADGAADVLDLDAGPRPPQPSHYSAIELPPLILSAWGDAPDRVYFAGGRPGPGGGTVAVYDGEVVREMETPPGVALWWVWGTDRDRAWAVGGEGRILRLRGDAWRNEPTGLPADVTLYGVWGTPGDLWAVGGSPRANGPKGVVLRSVGDGQWRRVEHPALPDESNLFKVWGTAADDVHFVGEQGVAVRWDGETFHRHDVNVDRLFTIHGHGDLVLAVGGFREGVVVRWDGEGWVDESPPDLPGLSGVTVGRDGTALATGDNGTVLRRAPGGGWTLLEHPEAVSTRNLTLHAGWIDEAEWTVGGRIINGGPGSILTNLQPPPEWVPLPLPPDAAVPDAGTPDARVDGAPPVPDADVDAVNMPPDGAPDATPDADVDAVNIPPDAAPDVDVDAVDIPPDAASDVNVDAVNILPDAAPDAAPDVDVDAVNIPPDAAPDVDVDAVDIPPDAAPPEPDAAPPPGPLMQLPLAGVQNEDWTINNYVDRDPTDGVRDHSGAVGEDAKTYDGHSGVDFDIGSLRTMDEGVQVLAAAAGVVDQVHDGEVDRYLGCDPDAMPAPNLVVLRHDNGMTSRYIHLRNGSMAVQPDDVVAAGDVLGLVGSSGCSTSPHLHFEVRDPNGVVLSPLEAGLFGAEAPVYAAPLGLMEVAVRRGGFRTVPETFDPGPDDTVVYLGELVGVAGHFGGGREGDMLRLVIRDPVGEVAADLVRGHGAGRHSVWFRGVRAERPGQWRVEVEVRGEVVAMRDVEVPPDPPGSTQRLRPAVRRAAFGDLFAHNLAAGLAPEDIDIRVVGSTPRASTLYGPGETHHGTWLDMTREGFDARVAEYRDVAHIVAVDSYVVAGEPRYAAVWHTPMLEQRVFVDQTTDAWGASVNDMVAAGFHPTGVSAAVVAGERRITSVYELNPDGAPWGALDLPLAEYQDAFAFQFDAGRWPAHIDVYEFGGPRIVSVFRTRPAGSNIARHIATLADLEREHADSAAAGLRMRYITSYDHPDGVRYGANWSENPQ